MIWYTYFIQFIGGIKLDNNKFVLSFSGGKDSILSLYRMIKDGNKPVALLTTVNKAEGNSWTHSLEDNILHRISESLDIQILYAECSVEDYEVSFEEALNKAKHLGATMCVFGDIDIADHRKWDEERCKSVDLKPVFPLWNEDRESIVNDFIDSGFTAIIKKVNLEYLDESFLGKELTKEVLSKIKDTGSDCCGENGEYHTVVVDGPIFNTRIELNKKEISVDHGYGNLVIE